MTAGRKPTNKHRVSGPATCYFADFLLNRRLALGYTQEQMAELIGMNTAQYGRTERAERILTLPLASRICAALGITISKAFEGFVPSVGKRQIKN